MDELIYLVVVVIIGSLVVIPIILLSSLSSANTKINLLQKEIKDLGERLQYLIGHVASKEDIEDLLKNNVPLSTELVEVKIKEEIVDKAVEEETIAETSFDDPVIEVADKEPVVLESEIQEKEVDDTPLPEVESIPSYAALEKHEEKPIMVTVHPKPIAQQTERKVKEEAKNKTSVIDLVKQLFGENWLGKIGIVTLVLGVGFFVKYAIDKDWINEIGRVGIGLLTGGLIIAIAHKLKKTYHVFSSILVGGGISIFYITITLAFREYEIFSQSVAFGILAAVTVFSVILSLFYNRQELAIFSLIGGFCSPLMVSTGSGNYIVLFSFILILNSGMLFISLKRNWRLIGIVSYILSLLFFWVWLIGSFEDQFAGATIFASLFFVQFYLLAIIKHMREEKKLSVFQAFLILTNNLSILLALMFVFDGYDYDVRGLAVIAIALVNAVVMLTLFRDSKVDKNLIYLVIGVVMSFVTLAVPIQLEGYVVTMFWAAEMVLLLWLWQKSEINIFRLGFLVIGLLTIVSYLMDVNNYYIESHSQVLTLFINKSFVTGVVVILGFALSLFLLGKEKEGAFITIQGRESFSLRDIKYFLKFILILFIFLVPYLELNYQLGEHTDTTYSESFRYVSLATYTTWFIAGLALLFRNRINTFKYYFFGLGVVLYTTIYSFLTIELRFDIFFREEYSSGYFLIHFLSLPAIAYLVYLLVKNIKPIAEKRFKVMAWALTIVSYIILSIELDHVVAWLVGSPDSYFNLLYDVHTFGYPILWGIIAMALMIWGLRKKEVILRQISLISFGLIILKFYAYDVWLMSQTGRIFSFVVLGVILLVVSFMQQKIKTLVKDDNESEIMNNKMEE